MKFFERLYQSAKSGVRAFGESLSGSDPKLTRSVVFNLAAQISPDDRYSGLIFACIDAITAQACQAKPRLLHYSADGEAVRDFDHELIKLLYRPNEQQTWYDLIKWTVGYREVRGNAFWYLAPPISGGKKPVKIFVLDPARMTPVYERAAGVGETVAYWEYITPINGEKLQFDTDEIVSFPYFSPYSQLSGVGPMQSARLEQDNDLSAQAYLHNLYQNGAMPSGVLSSNQELTDETVARVAADWRKTYAGEKNIGKTLILEQGLKYERLSLSMQDLAFIEGRKDAREAILQIFRVPRSLLGSSGSITRANAEADVYAFAKNKIVPMMEDIYTRLNYFVLPKFGLNPAKSELKFKEIVPEDRELTLKEHDTYLKDGALTINEVRARQGLEAVAWGDQPFQMPTSDDSDIAVGAQDDNGTTARSESVSMQETRRASDGRFDHARYRRDFDKTDRALVRRHRQEIQKSYDEAAKIITDHLVNFWPSEKRALSARDLRVLKRALPGELESVMPLVENKVLSAITGVLSEGYFKAKALTYRYIIGKELTDESGGMYLANPEAVDYVTSEGLKDAGSISRTMKKEAQRVVADAIINGDSTDTLAKTLKDTFAQLSDYKAETIARTETHKAMSEAAHQTALDTGIKMVKKWDDSGDDRVCAHCRANSDAGWIAMSDAYPGGQTSPADEHPNGRCVEYFEPAEWHKDG